MSRHAARERALETLFQMDINDVSLEEASAYTHLIHDESKKASEYDEEYFHQLLRYVLLYRQPLDVIIDQLSTDWELDRMPGVDRNILRLSLYEMLYEDDIPSAVVINEAVELAKSYSSGESRKFINGILSSVLKMLPELKKNNPPLSV
jgi:N utilization substance protein B